MRTRMIQTLCLVLTLAACSPCIPNPVPLESPIPNPIPTPFCD